jgi:chloramphenicol 3-O phosphotransferase
MTQKTAAVHPTLPGETAPGRIILLNGTSSSGKSSIAKELSELLDGPYYSLAVDAFNAMRDARELDPNELGDILYRMRRGFHRAVAGMAAGGNNLIVDHVLSESWRLRDCLEQFAPFDVVFVGVHCSQAELERREQMRGDRPPGLAAQQLSCVHEHALYDIECDTTTATPRECAQHIRDQLAQRSAPSAFEQLRLALQLDA